MKTIRKVRQVETDEHQTEFDEARETEDFESRPDGAIVVPLKYPFEVKQRRYTELVVRRARAGDLRALDQQTTDYGRAARLVALLTGVTDAVVDELDGEDFGRVSEVAIKLLGKSRRTGPTS